MTSTKNKEVKRGEVYWVNLDLSVGTEIQKTCPAVLSNNIQNKASSRVVVIPVISNTAVFPFEARVNLNKQNAKALTDKVRTVDKSRFR